MTSVFEERERIRLYYQQKYPNQDFNSQKYNSQQQLGAYRPGQPFISPLDLINNSMPLQNQKRLSSQEVSNISPQEQLSNQKPQSIEVTTLDFIPKQSEQSDLKEINQPPINDHNFQNNQNNEDNKIINNIVEVSDYNFSNQKDYYSNNEIKISHNYRNSLQSVTGADIQTELQPLNPDNYEKFFNELSNIQSDQDLAQKFSILVKTVKDLYIKSLQPKNRDSN